MTISELRREYNLTGLRRKDLDPNPIIQFQRWFEQATGARRSGKLQSFLVKTYKSALGIDSAEMGDLNAMILATADAMGCPSVRVVLLKGLDERGFCFYTNYTSRKARELTENPMAALDFFWPHLERQVCVAGKCERLGPAESDTYFRSRPRGSQIGAWASDQSSAVADRAQLELKWEQLEKQYANKEVPRPPHWGGFLLRPFRMEFWQGRPNRLHDRFCYTRQDDTWKIERLAP
jgi:pyridoxamine 5'-phosphate oxidase